MKIKATVSLDGLAEECTGQIIVHWAKSPQAYVTWRLERGGNLVASHSCPFHYTEADTIDTLIQQVLIQIKDYRSGRLKIIENVQLSL